MTRKRKQNFAKWMLGVVVLALLFVGTWAATNARLTSAIKPNATKSTATNNANLTMSPVANVAPTNINAAVPLPVDPSVDVTSVFELDGNATDSPAGAPDDWSTLQSGNGTAGFTAKTMGTVAGGVAIADLQGLTTFDTGGSKDDLDVPSWRYSDGSSPPKDEITNAYAALYVKDAGLGAGAETILVFGADRFAQSGSAQIGFWFFQQDVHPVAGSNTFSNAHSDGDILILSDFSQGGAISTIRVFRWNGPGGAIPGNGSINGTLDQIGIGSDCTAPGSPKFFCGQVNSGDTASPWAYDPKQGPDNVFPAGGFYEGAVNLTGLGVTNVCFAGFQAETRTSPSVDATLKDFVNGAFPVKPTVEGTGVALSCTTPTGMVSATSSDPNATFSWTGPNGFTCNTASCSVSAPGTYTVTASSAGGCASDPDEVTVTEDKTPPSVDAGANQELTCLVNSVTLDGSPASGVTYSWARCTNPNDTSTCTITTGFTPSNTVRNPSVSTPGTYRLTVTSTTNGCTNSDLVTVTQDNSPPTVSIAKQSANGTTLAVTVQATASSNAVPAGTLGYVWQSCIATCGNNANWSTIGGQTSSSIVFSNFALDTSTEAINFLIGAGAGAGNYFGQLSVVNLRVVVTDSGNGCVTTSDPLAVKKVVAVDP